MTTNEPSRKVVRAGIHALTDAVCEPEHRGPKQDPADLLDAAALLAEVVGHNDLARRARNRAALSRVPLPEGSP